MIKTHPLFYTFNREVAPCALPVYALMDVREKGFTASVPLGKGRLVNIFRFEGRDNKCYVDGFYADEDNVEYLGGKNIKQKKHVQAAALMTQMLNLGY